MSHLSGSDFDVKHVFLTIMAQQPYVWKAEMLCIFGYVQCQHAHKLHSWLKRGDIPFHFEVRLWGQLQRLSQTLDTLVLKESDRDINNEERNASQGDTENKPWIIHLSWDATEHVTANRPTCAWNPRAKAHGFANWRRVVNWERT